MDRRTVLKGAAALTIIPASVEAAEHPADKVRRLSRELAAALDDVNYVSLVMVYPASKHDYPVIDCHDREFAAMTKALFDYRDKHRLMMERYEEFKVSPAGEQLHLNAAIKGDAAGYFEAKHKCDQALYRLVDTFDPPTIDA